MTFKSRALCILVLVLLAFLAADAKLEEVTRFYVVRHADKMPDSEDPGLSVRGTERALELLDALQSVPISAIYSTNFKRTKQTVEPIAQRANLPLALYPPAGQSEDDWLAGLSRAHRGQNVLIVGHSNTVPLIAQALSGLAAPSMDHEEYDSLLVITIYRGDTERRTLEQHRFSRLESTGSFKFLGELFQSKDLSAVIKLGDNLLIAADESASIQLLKKTSDKEYAALAPVPLQDDGELDIEGLASDERYLYVLGSHAKNRKKVEPAEVKTLNRDYQKNRERLHAEGIEFEASRNRIYRLALDQNRMPRTDDMTSLDLSQLLQKDPVLAPFIPLASKENGIDLEGIAVVGSSLFLGFRAPVLRSGFVPIMKLNYQNPQDYQLMFLEMGGRGVRAITEVSDGFLILAGPMGDAEQSYKLYHWNGLDTLPGVRAESEANQGEIRMLGVLSCPPGAKAEGLTLLEESEGSYSILLLFDGIANGAPQKLFVTKSKS